jgi:hypothetical protein
MLSNLDLQIHVHYPLDNSLLLKALLASILHHDPKKLQLYLSWYARGGCVKSLQPNTSKTFTAYPQILSCWYTCLGVLDIPVCGHAELKNKRTSEIPPNALFLTSRRKNSHCCIYFYMANTFMLFIPQRVLNLSNVSWNRHVLYTNVLQPLAYGPGLLSHVPHHIPTQFGLVSIKVHPLWDSPSPLFQLKQNVWCYPWAGWTKDLLYICPFGQI